MLHASRSLGIRLITAYKLVKAPVVLSLALWLSLAPHGAVRFAEPVVNELSEGGASLRRLAMWLDPQLTPRFETRVAIAAWVDGVSTAVEGLLLFQGSPWGEWIVVLLLGALVPFEAFSLERHPSAMRLLVLTVNALIVFYLVFDRLRRRPNGP
jgi:hypothetical protein